MHCVEYIWLVFYSCACTLSPTLLSLTVRSQWCLEQRVTTPAVINKLFYLFINALRGIHLIGNLFVCLHLSPTLLSLTVRSPWCLEQGVTTPAVINNLFYLTWSLSCAFIILGDDLLPIHFILSSPYTIIELDDHNRRSGLILILYQRIYYLSITALTLFLI